MLKRESKYHFNPIQDAAETGVVHQTIDNLLRQHPINTDPWDTITVLGAQLSSPPYDPYRERVNTDLRIGYGDRNLTLNSPLLIDGRINLPILADGKVVLPDDSYQ